jgi:hypothetical protein
LSISCSGYAFKIPKSNGINHELKTRRPILSGVCGVLKTPAQYDFDHSAAVATTEQKQSQSHTLKFIKLRSTSLSLAPACLFAVWPADYANFD